MKITANQKAEIWHPSVKAYSVHDVETGQLMGDFYLGRRLRIVSRTVLKTFQIYLHVTVNTRISAFSLINPHTVAFNPAIRSNQHRKFRVFLLLPLMCRTYLHLQLMNQ